MHIYTYVCMRNFCVSTHICEWHAWRIVCIIVYESSWLCEYSCTCVDGRMGMCMYIYMYICMNMHIGTYVYVYIQICICIYTCIGSVKCPQNKFDICARRPTYGKRHPHMGQETCIWVKRLTCTKRDPHDLYVWKETLKEKGDPYWWKLSSISFCVDQKLTSCPLCVKDTHIGDKRPTYG